LLGINELPLREVLINHRQAHRHVCALAVWHRVHLGDTLISHGDQTIARVDFGPWLVARTAAAAASDQQLAAIDSAFATGQNVDPLSVMMQSSTAKKTKRGPLPR
jgi:hypothetical protein